MKQYELTYLVEDETDHGVANLVSELGGRIINTSSLGKRKLAYKIKKLDFGTFHVALFSAEKESADKLHKALQENTEIVRYLLIERKIEALPEVKFDEKLAESKEENVAQVKKAVTPEEIVELPAEPAVELAPEETAEAVEESVGKKPKAKKAPKAKKTAVEAEIKPKAPLKKAKPAEETPDRASELDKKLEELLKE